MTKALAYAYEELVTQKDLFKWKKFSFKKIAPTQETNLLSLLLTGSSEKGSTFLNSCNEKDKQIYLSVLAACTSIMESSLVPSEEKPTLLAEFTTLWLKNQSAPINSELPVTPAPERTTNIHSAKML